MTPDAGGDALWVKPVIRSNISIRLCLLRIFTSCSLDTSVRMYTHRTTRDTPMPPRKIEKIAGDERHERYYHPSFPELWAEKREFDAYARAILEDRELPRSSGAARRG